MSLRNEEQLYASIQRGMQAGADLSVVRPLLLARRETLIKQAIQAFRSLVPEKRMTDRDAILFVAALSEQQQLLDDIQAAIDDGHRAHKKLTS